MEETEALSLTVTLQLRARVWSNVLVMLVIAQMASHD